MAIDFAVNRIKPNTELLSDKPRGHKLGTKALAFITGESVDTKSVRETAKIAKSILNFLSYVPVLGFAIKIATFLGGISDFIKFLSIAKCAKDINDKPHNKLKTASAVFGLFIATMTGAKILDTLEVIKLAYITKSMGNVATFGSGTQILTFNTVLNVFDMTQCAIEIASAAKKIQKLKKDILHTDEKKQAWKQELTAEKARERIRHMAKKRADIKGKAKELAEKANKSGERVLVLEKAYEEKKRNIQKMNPVKRFFHKVTLHKPAKKLRSMRLLHNTYCDSFEAEKAKFEKLGVKDKRWKTIETRLTQNNLSSAEKQNLKEFCEDKAAKWDIKKIELSKDKSTSGVGIAISTVVIIALIASTILTLTGVGALAGTITLASVFLLISCTSLGLHLYNKHRKKKTASPVEVPQFA